MAMMISKFHKIIQSKIVWGVFAGLICIAFVGVFTPGITNSKEQRRAAKEAQLAGKLYGEDVSLSEFGKAYGNILVTYSLMTGRPVNMTKETEVIFRKMAWQRIAILKKAEQLGMTANPQQIIDMIQRQPTFQNPQTGQFDKNIYDAVVTGFLPRYGMREKDFENLFAEQVLIEKVSAIPAQGGLVTEEEIKKAYHLYTDLLTIEYAAVPRKLAETPEVTEEDAKAYYNRNIEQFRIPEAVRVDYVQFAVADYLDQVVATDEMISSFYEQNKQRFLREPAEDAPEGTQPEFKPLEEVKEQIAAEIKTLLARKTAVGQADILVSKLASENTTIDKAAEELGLKVVKNKQRFTATDPVSGVDPTAPFQRVALALEKTATYYFSDPVVGRDFVYVISLAEKFDSFLPAFDVVRDAAIESAKILATEDAYLKKAEAVRGEIQQALKNGSSFADAAKKQGLEVKMTEPFNITSPIENQFGQEIKAATARLDQGMLSGLIATSEDVLIAYVADKWIDDETGLHGMREELTQSIGNDKSGRLVAAWREKLLDEAGFEDMIPRADDDA